MEKTVGCEITVVMTIWNPSASVQLGFGGFGSGTYIGAGKHFVYILEIVKMKLMESTEVMSKKYLHMTLVSLLWIMEA